MGNNQREEQQGKIYGVWTKDWKFLLIFLLIGGILFCGGFLAGNLWRISLYHSQVEQLEDINSCYP